MQDPLCLIEQCSYISFFIFHIQVPVSPLSPLSPGTPTPVGPGSPFWPLGPKRCQILVVYESTIMTLARRYFYTNKFHSCFCFLNYFKIIFM